MPVWYAAQRAFLTIGPAVVRAHHRVAAVPAGPVTLFSSAMTAGIVHSRQVTGLVPGDYPLCVSGLSSAKVANLLRIVDDSDKGPRSFEY